MAAKKKGGEIRKVSTKSNKVVNPKGGRPRTITHSTKWNTAAVSEKSGKTVRSINKMIEQYGKVFADLSESDAVRLMMLPHADRTQELIDRGWTPPEEIHTMQPSKIGRAKGKPGDADEPVRFGLALPADFGDGCGMRVEVDKLKIAVAAARNKWGQMVSDGDPMAPKAFSVWTSLLEAWTKMSKDVPKALKELDDSVSREEFESALSAALQAVDRLLLGLPQKIGQAGQMLKSDKLELIVEGEVEALRDALFSGRSHEENNVLAEIENERISNSEGDV